MVEVRLLGPVEVWSDGTRHDIDVRRGRFVLAVLALEINRPVPVQRLVELAWPGPPPNARAALHTHMARIRSALRRIDPDGAEIAVGRDNVGYVLNADPHSVDAHRFRALTSQARSTDGDEEKAELLRQALRLWRGPALTGVCPEEVRTRLCRGLDEARLAATEDRFDAELRLSRHRDVIEELTATVAEHPHRQRLTGQLMLALHRDGRTEDALAAYRRTAQRLADDLGLDPGPELRQLELAILRGEVPAIVPSLVPVGDRRPVPAQLPADVHAFTGRTAELDALDKLTADTPTTVVISAISGTAGVGKTALAVRWAHHARVRFPDGQLYVDLRGYHPEQPMASADALARFLRDLGVPGDQIPVEVEERSARYRSETAGRRMLIVLDNAGNVEQVRPLLPGAGTSVVIVTSRDALAGLVAVDGARRLDLDLFALPDAVALLNRLIGNRAEADPTIIESMAERCARLPLALRIVAELVNKGTSKKAISEELDLTSDQIDAAIVYDRIAPRRGRPPIKRRKVRQHVPAD